MNHEARRMEHGIKMREIQEEITVLGTPDITIDEAMKWHAARVRAAGARLAPRGYLCDSGTENVLWRACRGGSAGSSLIEWGQGAGAGAGEAHWLVA